MHYFRKYDFFPKLIICPGFIWTEADNSEVRLMQISIFDLKFKVSSGHRQAVWELFSIISKVLQAALSCFNIPS